MFLKHNSPNRKHFLNSHIFSYHFQADPKVITLYEDKFKGVLNPSILVDITGDNITDIVTSMFNSFLVAFDGETFKQIWNFSVPGNNSESEITPTPGYFNFDNITDFLIIYETQINDTNTTSRTQVGDFYFECRKGI